MTKEPHIYPDGRMDSKNTSLYLGLAVKTLAQMRCDGVGPSFVKLGNRVFYFKDDVDLWINKNGRAVSTAEMLLANMKIRKGF